VRGKGISSFWLNALIITTVVLMWLSLAGSIVAGVVIASAVNDSPSISDTNYDEFEYDE
jgi:hypothetical protein